MNTDPMERVRLGEGMMGVGAVCLVCSLTRSSTEQILMKHLLCANHYSRYLKYRGTKQSPSLRGIYILERETGNEDDTQVTDMVCKEVTRVTSLFTVVPALEVGPGPHPQKTHMQRAGAALTHRAQNASLGHRGTCLLLPGELPSKGGEVV